MAAAPDMDEREDGDDDDGVLSIDKWKIVVNDIINDNRDRLKKDFHDRNDNILKRFAKRCKDEKTMDDHINKLSQFAKSIAHKKRKVGGPKTVCPITGERKASNLSQVTMFGQPEGKLEETDVIIGLFHTDMIPMINAIVIIGNIHLFVMASYQHNRNQVIEKELFKILEQYNKSCQLLLRWSPSSSSLIV